MIRLIIGAFVPKLTSGAWNAKQASKKATGRVAFLYLILALGGNYASTGVDQGNNTTVAIGCPLETRHISLPRRALPQRV